jgi:hypothetical protein
MYKEYLHGRQQQLQLPLDRRDGVCHQWMHTPFNRM